jgi:hypothetical protein
MDGEPERRFQEALLGRLPLAEATWLLWAYVLEEGFLADLYARQRGRGYQRVLSFATLVQLVADALVVHGGRAARSLRGARARRALPVSDPAAYGKLRRRPIPLSCALVAEGTQRLRALLPPAAPAWTPPPSLAGPTVVVLDGKKIKKVAKRLKLTRGIPGALLGGKTLVALTPATGLGVALTADPDGEANDVPLVEPLLPRVRAVVPGSILWVLDRQFCDLHLPALLTQGQDHFLVRYRRKIAFTRDPAAPGRSGVDAAGRPYEEEWGWLGRPDNPRRRYLRRITLRRADAEAVILLTDLLDADAVPAADLLAVYLARWGIERVFQQVTEVFELRRLIGSSPQATIFQFAFCLLLYNMLQVMRAHVAAQHAAQVSGLAALSTENLFYDVQHQMIAWSELGQVEVVATRWPGALGPAQVAAALGVLLAAVWRDAWIKAPPKKRWTPPLRGVQGQHTSVWRVLQAHRPRAPDGAAPAPPPAAASAPDG